MMKRIVNPLILVLLLCIGANATTVERLTLDGLVKKSQHIVVGKVSNSRTYWSDNGKLILTTYTVEVQESLKGQSPRSIEVTTIGGVIGDLTLYVSGMPTFEKGENAVLFIENTGAFSTVVGLGQGKFTVKNGEISNHTSGLEFPDGRPAKSMRMPLASFKQEILGLVGR